MVCEHLEAVTAGHIRRLIINVPPRHMKSLAVSVFWPAWHWLSKPSTSWLFASYAHSLSIRDSTRCRRIVDSPAYRETMRELHPKFMLMGDQNSKIRFDNSLGGTRIATSVDGALTGEGGDIIVVDDPHNVVEGESEAKRGAVLTWWDEAMSTRLNDPNAGAYVLIMQRIHEKDLTGHILAKEHGWDHICLPARYEGIDRVSSSLGARDGREQLDEPLWPARFGDKKLAELEEKLGSYASAGQLQQRPSPRKGGMFKVASFRTVKAFDRARIQKTIRYWDKAGTANGGCYSAGVKVHLLEGDEYLVEDVRRGRWGAYDREQMISNTAASDGKGCRIWTEQEPGSGGKESAESTIKRLAGFIVKADRVTGSKESRAEPYAAQVEAGNIMLLDASWNQAFIEEHRMFPNGEYKDQVDAAAGAFNKLVGNRIRPHVGATEPTDKQRQISEASKQQEETDAELEAKIEAALAAMPKEQQEELLKQAQEQPA